MPSNTKKIANPQTIKSPIKSATRPIAKLAIKTKVDLTGPAPKKRPSPSQKPKPKPTKSPKDPAPPKLPKAIDLPTVISKTPSKQAIVITLLRKPDGSNLAELMQTTGWQAHSIRGFLSGTIKKKLGLNLISQKQDGVQYYKLNAAD